MSRIVYYRDDGSAIPLNWETLDEYFLDDHLGATQIAWEQFRDEIKESLRKDLLEK